MSKDILNLMSHFNTRCLKREALPSNNNNNTITISNVNTMPSSSRASNEYDKSERAPKDPDDQTYADIYTPSYLEPTPSYIEVEPTSTREGYTGLANLWNEEYKITISQLNWRFLWDQCLYLDMYWVISEQSQNKRHR